MAGRVRREERHHSRGLVEGSETVGLFVVTGGDCAGIGKNPHRALR
jgi:hypothetical protein